MSCVSEVKFLIGELLLLHFTLHRVNEIAIEEILLKKSRFIVGQHE